jgi:hypothetical protein
MLERDAWPDRSYTDAERVKAFPAEQSQAGEPARWTLELAI